MKSYLKTHTNKKAALAHIEKIKARGGKHTLFEENGAYRIAYHFPEKPDKKKVKTAKPKAVKATKNKKSQKATTLYDIISPDGFTIRMPDVPLFKTRQEGMTYFKKWKKRYEAQGYYSSNYGRIPLMDLADECSWEEIPSNKADTYLGFKMR